MRMLLGVKRDGPPWIAPTILSHVETDSVLHLHNHRECTCIKPPYQQQFVLSQRSYSHNIHASVTPHSSTYKTKWSSVLITSSKYASTPHTIFTHPLSRNKILLHSVRINHLADYHQGHVQITTKMSLVCFLIPTAIITHPNESSSFLSSWGMDKVCKYSRGRIHDILLLSIFRYRLHCLLFQIRLIDSFLIECVDPSNLLTKSTTT